MSHVARRLNVVGVYVWGVQWGGWMGLLRRSNTTLIALMLISNAFPIVTGVSVPEGIQAYLLFSSGPCYLLSSAPEGVHAAGGLIQQYESW